MSGLSHDQSVGVGVVCASVTKQYNLVPAKGRWCSAAGKVTVGLVSHWPCRASQTQWSIHLRAQRPMCGRWAPYLRSTEVWSPFTFTLPGWSIILGLRL